jgi:hypothetical protein
MVAILLMKQYHEYGTDRITLNTSKGVDEYYNNKLLSFMEYCRPFPRPLQLNFGVFFFSFFFFFFFFFDLFVFHGFSSPQLFCGLIK